MYDGNVSGGRKLFINRCRCSRPPNVALICGIRLTRRCLIMEESAFSLSLRCDAGMLVVLWSLSATDCSNMSLTTVIIHTQSETATQRSRKSRLRAFRRGLDELLNGADVTSSRVSFDVCVAGVDDVAITAGALFTMQKIQTSNVVHVRSEFPHLMLATLIY